MTSDAVHPLTVEHAPDRRIHPMWLAEIGPDVLVIHPTEAARAAWLDEHPQAHPDAHRTLQKLLIDLRSDLRMRPVLDADGVLFEGFHARLVTHLEAGELHLLGFPPTGGWSRARTGQLLGLMREVATTVPPWRWEADPGAEAVRMLLEQEAESRGGLHPILANLMLLERLQGRRTPPFSLEGRPGVLILDHAPGWTDVTRSALQQVLRWCPIHQVCAPGSSRLGLHGEVIVDQPAIKERSELPGWIPEHDVTRVPTLSEGMPPRGRIHILHVQGVTSITDATLDLATTMMGRGHQPLFLEADAERRRTIAARWDPSHPRSSLNLLGEPILSALVDLLSIGTGPDAWSLERILRFHQRSQTWLRAPPWAPPPHPSRSWSCEPDLELLRTTARGLHLRGGFGARERWVRALAEDRPRYGRSHSEAQRANESTQWWLASVMHWASTVSGESRDAMVRGCVTGDALPMPIPPMDPGASLRTLISGLDWDRILDASGDGSPDDRTVASLQVALHLADDLEQLPTPPVETSSQGAWMTRFTSALERTPTGARSADPTWLQGPDEAFGRSGRLLVLSGLDVKAWPLRPRRIPFIDVEDVRDLDLLGLDIDHRRARHWLASWMDAFDHILILIAGEDEEGPASPLREWLDVHQRHIQHPSVEDLDHLGLGSAWDHDPGSDRWCYRPWRVHISEVGGPVQFERHGSTPRDVRQRIGLALEAGDAPTTSSNHPHGIARAWARPVWTEAKGGFEDGVMGAPRRWEHHATLPSIDLLRLVPPASGRAPQDSPRTAETWPHLGGRLPRGHRISNDPRPLAGLPFPTTSPPSDPPRPVRIGHRAWSPSRIQAWMRCPRRAWLEEHRKVVEDDRASEDVDPRIVGEVIHEASVWCLEQLGVPEGATIEGPPASASAPEEGLMEHRFRALIRHLAASFPWLSRSDGVTDYRRQELLGLDARTLESLLSSDRLTPPTGRIGALLQATFDHGGTIPIANEWSFGIDEEVHLIIPETLTEAPLERSIRVRGTVDRVDVVHGPAPTTQGAPLLPLDWDRGQAPASRRQVVVRDLKSVRGPQPSQSGHRHLSEVHEQVQLALYARAWEVAHPGDRVVGVGITEIGDRTTQFLELDPEIELDGQDVITSTAEVAHRRASEGSEPRSNPFRMWLRTRLDVAARVVESAMAGHVHPTPNQRACSTCSVRDGCPLDGGDAS